VANAAPSVSREADRLVVTSGSLIEEVLIVPSGLVWTRSSEVWGLFGEDEPRVLSSIVDPHSLVTDGKTVYWLGHEKNQAFDLGEMTLTTLSPFDRRSQQATLAFGDALYGRSWSGSLWLYENGRVRELPFRADPSWFKIPGLGAGGRRLFLPAAKRTESNDVESFIMRIDRKGIDATIAVARVPRLGRWDVSRTGDLAYVSDKAGTVMLLTANAKKPIAFLEGHAVESLCWCGHNVCAISDGNIYRHRAGEASMVLVPRVGPVSSLSCGHGRLAWLAEGAERTATVIVISVPA
jgi:hypothetical protein